MTTGAIGVTRSYSYALLLCIVWSHVTTCNVIHTYHLLCCHGPPSTAARLGTACPLERHKDTTEHVWLSKFTTTCNIWIQLPVLSQTATRPDLSAAPGAHELYVLLIHVHVCVHGILLMSLNLHVHVHVHGVSVNWCHRYSDKHVGMIAASPCACTV